MTDGFVVVDGPAADLNGPGSLVHGTGLPTLGTGLMIAEALRLLAEDLLDGPLDHGPAHVDGQGLDGVEVEVEPRPLVAVSAAGDDFSPPLRQVAERRQIVGLSPGERHGESILELGEREKMGKSP